MKQNGSPSPEFDFDDDHTFFLCRLPVHSRAEMRQDDKPSASVESRLETTGQVAGQVTGQVAGQVPEEVRRLICTLQTTQTRKQLQEFFKLKGRANFEERYLKPAIEGGFVELTIPDKPNSRLQKYRLTDKGRAWLADAQT